MAISFNKGKKLTKETILTQNSILDIPTCYRALYHSAEHHSYGDASVQ